MADDEQHTLFEELHRRSSAVVELDPAQVEGFVSGLFAAWDDDAEVSAFIEFCRARPGPVSATLCAALAVLAGGPVAVAAERCFDSMADHAPAVAQRLGRGRPIAAWTAQAPFGRSIVIGCAGEGDEIDHAVLAELDDDELLNDLRLSGDPSDLVESGLTDDPELEVRALELSDAVRVVRRAWRAALDRVEPSPGILANQRLVRLRLGFVEDEDEDEHDAELPLFVAQAVSPDVTRGMSPSELAQANAAARSTLRAAIGEPGSNVIDDAWVEVVRGTVSGVSPREREALLWLEWADWLGAGIGLLRHRDDGPLDGFVLVDLVNGCPEVSSTIHGDDRDYAAWAFDVALEHLADAGLIVDGLLTEAGRASLHPSLLEAWADR